MSVRHSPHTGKSFAGYLFILAIAASFFGVISYNKITGVQNWRETARAEAQAQQAQNRNKTQTQARVQSPSGTTDLLSQRANTKSTL